MKETVILAPGANGSELLRSLAKRGVNTLGVRVMNALELAKTALMKSGISIDKEFITSGSGPSVIFSFLNSIDYFKSASFADAEQLFSALCTMRMLVSGDEAAAVKAALDKGEFKAKNDAIFDVYSRYLKTCDAENKTDSISIIRRALAEANPFSARFICLDEFPLMPLEMELLDKVSNSKYEKINLIDLYKDAKGEDKQPRFVEAYGSINEAEYIIADIFKSKTPLDKCVIACADVPSYAQLFFDLSRQHGLPMTFGSGVPIVNSNPARLLKLVNDWDTSGYNGIDSLKAIILSEAFDRTKLAKILGIEEGLNRDQIDRICKMAGDLRISFDAQTNVERLAGCEEILKKKLSSAEASKSSKNIFFAKKDLETLEYVKKLAAELGKGLSALIDNFSVIRPEPVGRIDQSAVNVITASVDAYMHYSPDGKAEEIIPEILNKTVCSENSREGCLHITSIKAALSCLRENLYVCGLSAANFPGSPTENYLLLDNDLIQFVPSEEAPTSAAVIGGKKKSLRALLNTARYIGTNTCLSYSDYDLAALKVQNPSSSLFEYFESLYPGSSMESFKKAFSKTGYFDNSLSLSDELGKQYVSGAEIVPTPTVSVDDIPDDILDKEWSPSSLEIFFQCPRRFYLTQVLGIPEEEPDDPFEVINSRELGTLAHSMMEDLAANHVDEKDFLEACKAAFDEYLKLRPPIHTDVAKRKKDEFVRMMKTSYRMDPRNEVLAAEEKYRFKHPSGVKLKGYPDRVEKTKSGEYIIADYKTGRKVIHKQNDIDTCLQVVIYAWLCGQAGTPISRCDYRYIRKNRTVACDFDDSMKQKLDEKLRLFAAAAIQKDFPEDPGKGNKNCTYCKVKDICNTNSANASDEAENE